ncbi:MAG: cytidine deaminase [Ginsengibacter sp.]
MNNEVFNFDFKVYDSIDELNDEDAELLREARKVTEFAYVPYSNFRVGAFAKLVNGEMVSGTNQENASYPAGICAERTLMSVASTLFPNVGIDTIAISYNNLNGKSNRPISPCGICRQSFVEFQQRTEHPIRVILSGMEGKVQIIENASSLLPFSFSADDMRSKRKDS